MKTARTIIALAVHLISTGIVLANASSQTASITSDIPPVAISFFYEPGCKECSAVSNEVLPELRAHYEGFYRLNSLDVGIKSNYMSLVRYQDKFKSTKNEPVCMVVDGKCMFNGLNEIQTGLNDAVDMCIAARLGGSLPVDDADKPKDDDKILSTRLDRFTLSAVIMAGFLDGINHCAISTIVFFMSLLTVSKLHGKSFLLMGVPFCIASFLTYFLIGLGLLRVFHSLSGFTYVRSSLNITIICVLVVLAILSFRDGFQYWHTGNPRDVAVKLPGTITAKIHGIMRSGIAGRSLIGAGLITGASVTALEGMCTGQVYVPTLVMLAKSGQEQGRAVSYLLLYNLISDIPLITILILTYFGMKTQTLLEWSKKNVVVSKVMLGVFFLIMAVVIAWM
jgi:hypothetical protein